MYQCENCGLKFNSLDDITRVLDMKDFFDRVQPGEIMPYGECLECGAVVHEVIEKEDTDLNTVKKLVTGFCSTCNKEASLITKKELARKKEKRMTCKSSKQKGRRAQQKVAAILVEALELTAEDFESIGMGQSGQDIRLTEKARYRWPFHAIEITSSLNHSVWAKFTQAQEHARKQKEGKIPGNGRPILIFKKNNTALFAMMLFEDLVAAIRERTRFPR